MTIPFRVHRLIEFSDTDMAGIVHFTRFFAFMESAEHAFFRFLGLSVSMNLDGAWISFPRVSASCDYLRPARFEDKLEIAVKVERLGGKSVTFGFEHLRGDVLLARGSITTVCCRIRPGEPMESVEIPRVIRDKLSPAA